MIRVCVYCNPPRRFGHTSGPADLITHGMCETCARVVHSNPLRPVAEIRLRATVPACQRRIAK